jgi:hypothetical protein
MCRRPHYEKYTVEQYNIDELMKQGLGSEMVLMKSIIQRSTKYRANFIISGSYAVFMYQKLHNKNPKWEYGDVDIYTLKDFELRETHPGAKIRDLSCTYDMVGYRYLSKVLWRKMDIKYVKQYKIEGEKTFNVDIIHIEGIKKERLYTLVDNFDLDCCKIAVEMKGKMVIFYIRNTFYADSYTMQGNKTEERKRKYRSRGFKCNDEIKEE